MSISDRLVDADILWSQGRKEGALLCALVAISAASREENPKISGDAEAFTTFFSKRLSISVGGVTRKKGNGDEVEVTLARLLYKWLRCELVHEGSVPHEVVISDEGGLGGSLWVRIGVPPPNTLYLSEAWYFWLRKQTEEWTKGIEPSHAEASLTIPDGATVAWAIGSW